MSTAIPPPPEPSAPTPPGVVLPTVLPYTTGTSTPMQSSYQAGINASNLQNNRNNALSGGKKKDIVKAEQLVIQYHNLICYIILLMDQDKILIKLFNPPLEPWVKIRPMLNMIVV